MEDIKGKLLEIENQVSVIKDPILRKVAFEKLLDGAFITVPQKNTKTFRASVVKSSGAKDKKRKSNLFYSEAMVRPEVKALNVTGSLKGFPTFKSCDSKIDSYLWVLAFGKAHKIDGMNIHEIAQILSKKLFKPTKYSTVYGIRKRVREGVVMKEPDNENFRITPDGEEYLKKLNMESKNG